MTTITDSSDITTLNFRPTFDLSLVAPQIRLLNQSSGPGLANCTWWYVVTTPLGTILHAGSAGTPDISGVWTNTTMPNTWTQPYGQIEFSNNAPYVITLYVKDAAAHVYSDRRELVICRPIGNKHTSQNNFGVSSFNDLMRCDSGDLTFDDTTNYDYQNYARTVTSNEYTLVFPQNASGTIPSPSTVSGANVRYALSYKQGKHIVYHNAIMSYTAANGAVVIIKYKNDIVVNVQCDTDFCGIICSYKKLIDEVANGSCVAYTSEESKDILLQINGKVNIALMGLMQPSCGIDVPAVLDEIKTLGNFDCNC